MKKFELVKNKYGYFEISNKPSVEELSDYYNKKYYQNGEGAYNAGGNYTEDEIKFFLNKVDQKFHAAVDVCPDLLEGEKTFLDIGAGEGWALNYFSKKGWKCLGLDFSKYGCAENNPMQVDNLLVGDVYSNMLTLFKEQRKFDVVLLDNVLEHVLDPLQILMDIKKILSDKGVLIVEVPNDFSIVQEDLLDKNYISTKYWLAFPDHLSYFNKAGLESLSIDAGWHVKRTITAFPIDLSIYNSNTNYIENRDVGKSCHYARVDIENLLHSISVEKTNNLYEAMADLGIGRDIIMIMT
jgi:2-polyprenyl-3-methyl-5-hydroxy-6-metoxy-1,4-benzoquinol methylase